jgi:hypothetical protein
MANGAFRIIYVRRGEVPVEINEMSSRSGSTLQSLFVCLLACQGDLGQPNEKPVFQSDMILRQNPID